MLNLARPGTDDPTSSPTRVLLALVLALLLAAMAILVAFGVIHWAALVVLLVEVGAVCAADCYERGDR